MEPKQEASNTQRNIIFDKYEMGRLLGQGTFAKVYYAKNIATNEAVAIKVISKDQVKKAGMMDQIQREISVMHLVRHPNVVELKEVMATRSRIYFVMEYIRGGELFAKVEKGRLKEEFARKYFQQLIAAVDFCHSRGVSHRDLKPENLLLDEIGQLKVSDFGLSALPEQLRQDGLLHTQCGTPAYVAPEVLKKKGYNGPKADIWSCGVILYVLLAGFLPFQDENSMKMYRKVFKGEYNFPPCISSDARRLISKLLVVDPEKRLSIEGIMRQSWFRKGFTHPSSFAIPKPNELKKQEVELALVCSKSLLSPRFYNAFEFISSMSSGFDLSSLFEGKRRLGSMFMSKCNAKDIVNKLELVAKEFNFQVSGKEFKVNMQAKEEGRRGKLSIMAEVFEVATDVAVVEFSKSSGDALEYAKFFEEDVRPALKDIVWSWQGENNGHQNDNA